MGSLFRGQNIPGKLPDIHIHGPVSRTQKYRIKVGKSVSRPCSTFYNVPAEVAGVAIISYLLHAYEHVYQVRGSILHYRL